MRLPFSHPTYERFLSRTDSPFPLAEPLQTLLPAGSELPYERVRELLAGQLLGELPLSGFTAMDDGLLGLVWLARADAVHEIDAAVAAGLLRLRIAISPERASSP